MVGSQWAGWLPARPPWRGRHPRPLHGGRPSAWPCTQQPAAIGRPARTRLSCGASESSRSTGADDPGRLSPVESPGVPQNHQPLTMAASFRAGTPRELPHRQIGVAGQEFPHQMQLPLVNWPIMDLMSSKCFRSGCYGCRHHGKEGGPARGTWAITTRPRTRSWDHASPEACSNERPNVREDRQSLGRLPLLAGRRRYFVWLGWLVWTCSR